MKEEDKREYPELSGKEILYIAVTQTEEYKVRGEVVCCDYNIGITVIAKETNEYFDKNDYLICCIGPLAPNKEHLYDRGQADLDVWDEVFISVLNRIKEGEYKTIPSTFTREASEESCPFGQ